MSALSEVKGLVSLFEKGGAAVSEAEALIESPEAIAIVAEIKDVFAKLGSFIKGAKAAVDPSLVS